MPRDRFTKSFMNKIRRRRLRREASRSDSSSDSSDDDESPSVDFRSFNRPTFRGDRVTHHADMANEFKLPVEFLAIVQADMLITSGASPEEARAKLQEKCLNQFEVARK